MATTAKAIATATITTNKARKIFHNNHIRKCTMNTFGNIYRLSTFGESHGAAIGGVVDGMPPGIKIDLDFIQSELDRRRPGQSKLVSSRSEGDRVELVSGVFEGFSTGTPIGFLVRNTNQHSSDYENLRHVFRPSHADFTYQAKYGLRDHRGGGRSSARETVSRVVGGALAKLVLKELGIDTWAYTSQVGDIKVEKTYLDYDRAAIEQNPVRCICPEKAMLMAEAIQAARTEGDTLGGTVTGVISGLPAGLGEPVFGKFHAMLGAAMLSINAAKAFEIGDGFDLAELKGSEANDIFCRTADGRIGTLTNHSGGVQGGITNGNDVVFRTGFKPVATLLKEQPTVETDGRPTTFKAQGRHDPCVLPRAVPIVEAMAAMVTLDALLLQQSRSWRT